MAGLVTLGNRAYERINKVLGLFGVETVNDIDLSTAFPVHDLTPVVESSLGGLWTFHAEETAVGAATNRREVNPNDGTDWDVVVTPDNSVIATPTDDDVPDLDDYDIWILWVGMSYDANVTNANIYLKTSIGVSGDYTVPLTTNLSIGIATDGTVTALTAVDEEYYQGVQMPYKMQRRWTPEIRISFSGAGNCGIFVATYAAPHGVVPSVFGP